MHNDLALLTVALGALISIGVTVALGVIAALALWWLESRK